MNLNQLHRLLFQPISLLIQQLTWIIYPVLVLIFKKSIHKKTSIPILGELEVQRYKPVWDLEALKTAQDELRDEVFLNDDDNHTAIVHAHLWHREDFREEAHIGLRRLVRPNGEIARRAPVDTEWYPVSGDCLSSWVFAAVSSDFKDSKIIHKVADHYVKSGLGIQHFNKKVSARCSNGGVNLCFDAWPVKEKWWPFSYGLMQPALGPQYFTTAAILKLAGSVGSLPSRILYKALYLANYLLFQGPMFSKWPVLYTKTDIFYYTMHITMMNLYSLQKISPNKTNLRSMKSISEDLSPKGNINPFFFALRYDCGDLSETQKHRALDILVRMPSWNGFIWQDIPTEYNYFQKERPNVHHNNVGGFVARLLSKNPK